MNSSTMKKAAAGVAAGLAMTMFLAASVAAAGANESAQAVAATEAGLDGAHDFQWMCQQYLEIMSTSPG